MTIEIQKLRFKEVGYIVDGKSFNNKEEAKNEVLDKLADAVIEILNVYNKIVLFKKTLPETYYSNVNLNVNINESLLKPEWYANKPFNKFFEDFLLHLKINFNSDEGGNYKGNYMYLIPGESVIQVPKKDELIIDLLDFELKSKIKLLD